MADGHGLTTAHWQNMTAATREYQAHARSCTPCTQWCAVMLESWESRGVHTGASDARFVRFVRFVERGSRGYWVGSWDAGQMLTPIMIYRHSPLCSRRTAHNHISKISAVCVPHTASTALCSNQGWYAIPTRSEEGTCHACPWWRCDVIPIDATVDSPSTTYE